jgi:hypothetical protein
VTAAAPQHPFSGVVLDVAFPPLAAAPRLPVDLLSREQKAAELQLLQQRRAMDAAREAELILGLAEDTSDRFDPPRDAPGAKRRGWTAESELPGVSEFFTAELAMILDCGRGTASFRAARAWTWRECLPATFAALGRGDIDERRAAALADVLQHTSPELGRRVEARLLDEATSLSVGRLKARATELVLELDPEAADRRRTGARQAADVRVHPSHSDGMSTLAAELPTDEAAEGYAVVDQIATMLKGDGDPRPIGEIRAAVLSMLVRRPADHGFPHVVPHVTVTAALDALTGRSSEAGAVDGLPVTAAHLRELLARVEALGLRTPDGGSLIFAVTDAAGGLLATLDLGQLQRLARRGCRVHPGGACQCPVTGPPGATAAYEPTAAQRMWVRTRDRRCRFPHCGQRVGWADLDHVIPHATGGETCCSNLCCLCRSHHRLKTFARGWRFAMDPDGTLHVTTPSGITRTTRPPGLRRPQAEFSPDDRQAGPPPEPLDDPPPF